MAGIVRIVRHPLRMRTDTGESKNEAAPESRDPANRDSRFQEEGEKDRETVHEGRR